MTAVRRRHESVNLAFSLLEVSLVMGVLLLLAGGIFSLTSASLDMTFELHEFEEVELKRERFIELCELNLERLPGPGRIRLEQGSLILMNTPQSFNYGARRTTEISTVVLKNQADGAGHFQIRVLYLNPEETAALERNQLNTEPSTPSLPLLRNVRMLSWRAWDPVIQAWTEEWFQPANPPLLELTLAFVGENTPTRAVMAIPLRQTPPRFDGSPTTNANELNTEPETEPEA